LHKFKEEGRRKKKEGRRNKEEGRRKKETNLFLGRAWEPISFLLCLACLYLPS